MLIKLGGALHRYIALAMCLFVVYGLSMMILSLLAMNSDAKEQYENTQFQLKKYQKLAATLPQVQSDSQVLTEMNANDDRYLVATSSSLAAAEIQKKLQQIIQQLGANLISMQTLNGKTESGFLPIKMQLHLRLTNEALIKLLYQLESQRPTGFVYNLQIQRQAGMRMSGQIVGEDLLDIQLEYTTFMVTSNDS